MARDCMIAFVDFISESWPIALAEKNLFDVMKSHVYRIDFDQHTSSSQMQSVS